MTCDSRCSDAASTIIKARIAAAAVFRQTVRGRQDSEAVVPMDVPDAPVMILFDNRSGYSTGVALLNPAPLVAATYSIKVIDNMGVTLREESLSIPPLQKRVFVLAERYPNRAGTFGHVLITGSSVVAMGLRFNPNGSFTSSHAVTFVPQ